MRKTARLAAILVMVIWPYLWVSSSQAAISSCGGSVSPTSINPNSTAALNFTISNGSATNIVWVKITPPSGFQAVSNTTFSTNIAPNSSTNLTLTVLAGASAQGPTAFSVQASDDSEGASAINCSGSFSVEISSTGSSTLSISNLSVSTTPTSATVKWNTLVQADSQVNYGTSTSYGSSSSDPTLVTSHSLTLSNLTNSTTYHFQIKSSGGGQTTTSADSTFITLAATPTPTPTPTPGQAGQNSAVQRVVAPNLSNNDELQTLPLPASTPNPDHIIPTVAATTDFSHPFGPTNLDINGIAKDNLALAEVDYSIDGGKNWLVVKQLSGKTASFSFTPKISEDDNYNLMLRAVDQAGNIGLSSNYTLIYDTIPPQIGAVVITPAANVSLAYKDGLSAIVSGMDQTLSLLAIGGPTKVQLLVFKAGQDQSQAQTFDLSRNLDNGLWITNFKLMEGGQYHLLIKAVDGAGNNGQKQLQDVVVLPPGTIIANSKVITGARASLYYFNPSLDRFVLWDGSSFGQDNPQSNQGSYSFLVPAGKYFLQFNADGYGRLRSQIFEISQLSLLNQNVILHGGFSFNIGDWEFSWPLLINTFHLNPVVYQTSNPGSELIGKSLSELNSETLNSLSFRGKPAVVTFLSSWMGNSADQLKYLNKLQNVNQLIVMPGDSSASANLYLSEQGSNFQVLADPMGQIADLFKVNQLPISFIFDANLKINQIKAGLTSNTELQSVLNTLHN